MVQWRGYLTGWKPAASARLRTDQVSLTRRISSELAFVGEISAAHPPCAGGFAIWLGEFAELVLLQLFDYR